MLPKRTLEDLCCFVSDHAFEYASVRTLSVEAKHLDIARKKSDSVWKPLRLSPCTAAVLPK